MRKSLFLVAMSLLVLGAVVKAQDDDIPYGHGRLAPGSGANGEIGLRFELRDGSALDAAPEAVPRAEAQTLDASRTQALLGRLPALEPETGDRQDFALRESSTPPPRTGASLQAPWPTDAERQPPAPPVSEKLTVTRHAPEGEVALAPHFSISFSQPMLGVATQAQAARNVPVRLSPQPAGEWRWLGTQTLMFQPDGRFPMATEYTANVPAGTRSALGASLEEEFSVRFATPPPSLVRKEPSGGPHELDPVLLLVFDQAVEPQAVLDRIQLRGQSTETYPLAPVDVAQLGTEHWLQRASENLTAGRWVALRATQPLPKASQFVVELAAGLPSLEGPRRSLQPSRWGFRTYAPLRVEQWGCTWRDGKLQKDDCNPEQAWQITFNNPLDMEAFDPKSIEVSPPVEGLQVDASNGSLRVSGFFAGRTRYQLSLPAGLADRFGQRLGQVQTLEFSTGDATARLIGPGKELLTLDPMATPALSVYSRNLGRLRLDIHRVGPKDWNAVQEWARSSRYETGTIATMPGQQLARRTIKVGGDPGELIETAIALDPYLKQGFGHLLMRVRPDSNSEDLRWQEVLVWVQSTHIGLVAVNDESRLLVWSSDLRGGSPLKDVRVGIDGHGASADTDADGLARLDLPLSGDHRLLVARQGEDSAILPRQASMYWSQPWQAAKLEDQLRWLVFDDRGMYRPGEQVRIKGWMRRLEIDPRGDLQTIEPQAKAVNWQLRDSRGVELSKGTTTVSALAGFDFAINLPATPNLGRAHLTLTAVGIGGVASVQTTHGFQIQEFRRPEYEVTANAGPGPFVIGESATLSVAASYYAGGGLASAPVHWQLTARPARYTPPNRSDWSFGSWIPWWQAVSGSMAGQRQRLQGKTDALGQHHVEARLLSVDPPRPSQLQAQATVTDVNRQAWSANTGVLVHPAAHYVGLQTDRSVVPPGQPIELRALAVNIDGEAVPESSLNLVMTRRVWAMVKGAWQEVDSDAQTCRQRQRKGKPVRCSFRPTLGGQYRVEATVHDGQGRANSSELRFWVPGGDRPPAREVELETLVLVPDREAPLPGDTVQVLVQAPFAPAHGLMTLSRGGILEQRRFSLEGNSATLSFEVDESMVPGVRLDVAVVGSALRSDDSGAPLPSAPTRPAAASASIEFRVPPLRRSLTVAVIPQEAVLSPGAGTVLDLHVTDADGKPVKDAELAVVVADEAVLALSGYRLPDPLDVFYAARPNRVASTFLHPQVVLANQRQLPAEARDAVATSGLDRIEVTGSRIAGGRALRSAPAPPPPVPVEMAAAEPAAEAGPAIALRSDFSALALFAPEVRTDAEGRAAVPLGLPDSLTRYRVMVVAVAGARHFGSGESAVTARKPLMLRASPPRFLNFGDQFELPLVLQNQTDQPMQIELAVRALNVGFMQVLQSTAPEPPASPQASTAGRRVTVPANDRVEVRFPAAAQMSGRAHFQAVASAGTDTDAQSFELPVWTPASSEAFATYGSLSEASLTVQPVLAPEEVWPQFGGLRISTASTELQTLTDAVLYLVKYPFECNEQRASRVLAIAALSDVLAAFETAGLPSPEELKASVQADLKLLAALQHGSGGWGFWGGGGEDWPYLGIHVANAFARADDKGFPMPNQTRLRSLDYLQDINRQIPSWYSEQNRRSLRAYAVDVRRRLGDADPKLARALVSEVESLDELPIDAIGWLLPTLHEGGDIKTVEALLRHLGNRVSETAAAAHFVTRMSEQGAHVLLQSDRRSDGVMLEALLEVRPQHDLIEKLVRGLLGHRVKGRWHNTQENAFILLGMDRYFHAREGVTPDYVARFWLDEGFLGEHAFRGRSTERFETRVPMSELTRTQEEREVLLQKDGSGRMYYRIGLDYAPRSLALAPADHGFTVERHYEGADDPDDVRRDPDGTWRIRAGARVKVELNMVASGRRTHVALVDPIPAGLEPINPALAVSEQSPPEPAQAQPYWWWHRPWYEHQNLRDERVEAFTSLLWSGVYSYSYFARATTPGRFVVPPTRAEEMYNPETFGRGKTDRVVVE